MDFRFLLETRDRTVAQASKHDSSSGAAVISRLIHLSMSDIEKNLFEPFFLQFNLVKVPYHFKKGMVCPF
jgi:hypothetical protein